MPNRLPLPCPCSRIASAKLISPIAQRDKRHRLVTLATDTLTF
jgi:hypothetical protein